MEIQIVQLDLIYKQYDDLQINQHFKQKGEISSTGAATNNPPAPPTTNNRIRPNSKPIHTKHHNNFNILHPPPSHLLLNLLQGIR
jgi:hypothetical protein